MFKFFTLLVSAVSIGVSRVPLPHLTNMIPLTNGMYYETDLQNTNDNAPFNYTYNSDGNFDSVSVNYNDQYGSLKSRTWGANTYTCDSSTILLMAFAYGNLSLTYGTENGHYAYQFLTDASTSSYYFICYYSYSLGQIRFDSNMAQLNVNFTTSLYSSSDFKVGSFNTTYLFIDPESDVRQHYFDVPLFSDFNDYDYINFNLVVKNNNDLNVYSNGYNDGYSTGYNGGYGEGYSYGYDAGHGVGYNEGVSSHNFADLLFTVADTPIYYLKSLFNFELFGMKMYGVVMGIMTAMVVAWVVRKLI